ncbi:glycerate kinase [Algoriphagus lacus]|uniref:Glycerate kinase n=1 Tax=Algoriphagus lacus TaxID=2056311 RepID=A0A418PQM1_9BACT|nr:glycerate kinase [Algoriphagus lacus]RIW14600.1 glycerate kinase [Algoriphagus lacus]
MRFLVAPNAFKGTIPADEAAEIISDVLVRSTHHNCLLQPVADGGDGTCALLIESLGLESVSIPVLNAIGVPVQGFFGWDPESKKAFIDVSTASGLGALLDYQKDPYTTSTFGTGLLIKKAIEFGAEEIVLGLGGSATVDMGTGILNALGVLFLDETGRELPVFSPGFLSKIKHVQKSLSLPKIRFTCLCDVKNPFFGAEGAVKVFGPQKGLKLDQLDPFEKDCELLLELFRKKVKRDWHDLPGFGAAGGIALGLDFFFKTQIKFGADYFFDLVDMRNKVNQSDWIITGEGQYDTQSNQGKASYQLLKLAKEQGKKIALITAGEGGRKAGFDLVLELPPLEFSSKDFKKKARENLHGLIQIAIHEKKFD